MEKLSFIKFYTDTETTGLSHVDDQILSYSAIIENIEGKNIEEYEKTVNLKENILPDPKSLIINNINPFLKDYVNSSLKETDLQQDLLRIANKAYKCIFIAYNAEFDEKMYHALFSRLGYNFYRYFPMIWDPLITAKKLIEKGLINTPEIVRGTKAYKTSKLEEVYKALGNDSSGFNAHTALDDTRMLQTAAHGIFYLATQRLFNQINPIPHTYQQNELYSLVYNDDDNGLIIKNVKIIQNNNKNSSLLVLNVEEQTEILDYYKIYDQFEFEGKQSEQLLMIDSSTLQIPEDQILSKRDSHSYINYINDIKTHARNIYEQKDNIDFLKTYINNLDKKTLKEIEDYSYSEYNEFVLEKINGLEYKIQIKEIKLSDNLILKLDPAGKFILVNELNETLIETEKKGDMDKLAKELLEKELGQLDKIHLDQMIDEVSLNKISQDTTFILEKDQEDESLFFIRDIRQSSRIIEDKLTVDILRERMTWWLFKVREETIKTIMKQAPSLKSFEIPKHPLHLLEEYNEMKADVFQTSNKAQKEILRDLLSYYKRKFPSIFNNVSLPNFQLNLSSFLKKP